MTCSIDYSEFLSIHIDLEKYSVEWKIETENDSDGKRKT